ncbi:MAG TPA: PorT family protein [Flavobacteriia bacterium]|nr:PorT family protein [Flavobacteriia bacterium]
MKNLTLLFISVLFSFNLYSQTYFGVKLGANYSSFRGDVDYIAYKGGFHVGGVAEFPIDDSFSFQPELLYSVQGYQADGDASLRSNYNYLQVPLMVKYFVKDLVTIDGGPQVGYLLSTTQTNGYEEIIMDQKENSNALDYGFNLGATYEMDSGIFLQVRYNFGLANVLKKELEQKAYNSVLQLSMGYKFY